MFSPPVKQTANVRQALNFQLYVLKFAGLQDVAKSDHRAFSIVIRVIGLLWLLCGWVCFGLNVAVAIAAFINSTSGGSSVLEFITLLPYATQTFRSVAVSTLFLFRLPAFEELISEFTHLAGVCFANHPEALRRAAKKWRHLAVFLAAVTVTLQVGWETIESLQYELARNISLFSDGALSPLPVSMLYWQYILLWVFGCTLLFFVSQQIFICVIVFGAIFADACKTLGEDLEESLHHFHIQQNKASTVVLYETLSLETIQSVLLAKQHYLRLCRLCEEVCEQFGLILFVIYGTDLVTCLGFVAEIVQNDNPIAMTMVFNFVGAAVAAIYMTAFMWPMVQAYEQSLRINGIIHDLISQVELQGFNDGREMEKRGELIRALVTFVVTSKDRVILFNAVEILHITRTFIFNTFAVVLSFVVITKEMFGKEALRLCTDNVKDLIMPSDVVNRTWHNNTQI
ncbi:hypothetical protein BV898_17689 [Hypsibius exemplaris]|uniref:Uncharacterized protein n=1 Tax=Hypsibius exemplaris TaxID=2072580 RepID=A0A9X6RMN9_HYPEX|nr:hypothetical protein BV898_17689 [Hypsibius exemplaris]